MSYLPGETVGPYEIVERQGQGGMATVYRAYHAALDRFVALKFLNPAYTAESSFLARFQREARVVARLEHPNIVPIYDFAEHDGVPYLVMKFIDGETLKERLFRGPLTLEEGLRVIEDVAKALVFAHQQGVLHRDIKPSNILIAEDGSIYLADFGLARIARTGSSTLSSEMLLGTPHYISPEQAQGDRDLDERTDVYSFGAVLYELIVGQVPFDGDTPFSIIHDHIYEPLPMPRSVNPDVPEAIERVLIKALAKSKAERYPSADLLLAAFQAAAAGDRIGVLISPSHVLPEAVDEQVVEEIPIDWSDEPDIEPAIEEPAELPRRAPKQPEKPEKAEKAEKQVNWTLIVAVVIVVCACLAVVFNARGLINQDPNRTPPGNGLTQAAGTVIPRTIVPTIGPLDRVMTAEALSTAGERRAALEQLLTAGEQFLNAKSYVQAAKVFQWVVNEIGGPSNVGVGIRDALVEALFMGAGLPEMEVVLEEFKSDYPDWMVITVVEGRRLLLSEDMEASAQIIDRALLSDPDDSLALALQVEWLVKAQEFAEAERNVNLLRRRTLEPWLLEHINQLAARIHESP